MEIAYQSSVFNTKAKALDVMSMSSVYAATIVVQQLLLTTKMGCEMSAFNVLRLLSKPVLLTTGWSLCKQMWSL